MVTTMENDYLHSPCLGSRAMDAWKSSRGQALVTERSYGKLVCLLFPICRMWAMGFKTIMHL